jgi:NADPH:quinone reductase
MRAWRVKEHGPPSESLVLEDVEPPRPGPGEVAVDVRATSLNFADILLCEGVYQVRPPLPFTPGLEASGIVTAVGEGADVPIGAHVAGLAALPAGGYAEGALVRADAVLVFPDDVPFTDVTVLATTYQTAHVALHHRGHLQPGESLLVHAAAGGVGSAALQVGLAAGATVIATAGGPEKVELCRRLGADHAVDYRAEDLYATVMELTDGRGVDVVYDPVGGPVAEPSRRLLAWEGRYLVIGFASGEIPTFPGNHVLVKNYSIVGVHWGAYAGRSRAVLDEAHDDLLRLYREGSVRPEVSETVPLADLPAALAALADRRTLGRVVVVP